MQAITFDHPGDETVLSRTELPDPTPSDGEVLVEVAAAGVNNADLQQRQGNYPPPPGASDILGLEVSGTIRALGPGVTGWAVGDRVCALLSGGGYASLAVVPATQLLPVPDDLDLVSAAALPEAACTVYSNIGMLAGLRPGQTLLVHGGTGGMGSHAVLWAKALGARVIATSGGERKVAASRELGADLVIDHRTEDFVARSTDFTDGAGVDVVLDVVGPAYLARNLEALAPNGHVAVIASGSGTEATLPFGLLMRKRATISGTTLRARPLAEKAEIVEAVRYNVWPFVADGRVRPVVDAVLPLAEAGEAHRRLAAGDVIGKLLLTP
ncbi:putative PIG3 family NAD(P)H quinone oxidoreductase [Curtobacterium sp. PhB130]|uniref:NAD(P)H-quinone oxidoreductase n=1 Tax=unclassified Curtobacterium TaxID=257496 RepID=UPI000F4C60CE|nr:MULTISPECIES: NAD(P)H-quinone oxidoreductase [unclassified Curtobacterium]ROS77302.1 putative PIG3 family NAD(P)H quinone oxidoreductase [Curtobacterium sp. PhB130]TCK66493.1 putative PIG3 family NAD(P)H quinone oxidoreductase [Curtobacterium sp. PhB136]